MKPQPTEAEWQATVVDLAHLSGWEVMHVRPAHTAKGRVLTPTTAAGWPDLVLWRPGQILYRELKTDRGRLSAAQRAVLASLAAAGADTGVWRPRDWEDVREALRRR